MTWDPAAYLAFGDERTRAARELLARIPVQEPHRIADVGCGPGNSTQLLAARWPDAEIDAIDNSPAMLERARETGIRARWVAADIAEWTPNTPYDLIYSNAALHWVQDHNVLLPRLLSFVRTSGAFAFQVPRNFAEPSHTIVHELASDPRFARLVSPVLPRRNVLDPETCFSIIEPFAENIDIWETCFLQALSGPDAVYRWMMGTALRPLADALQGESRDTFLAEYRVRAARCYPQRPSGVTLFPFRRLFCVAKR